MMGRMAWLAPRSSHLALAHGLGALLWLVGCKNDPAPASDETGTSTGEAVTSTGPDLTATSGVTTAPPPMTTDADSTTFGPGCGIDPCPEMCGRECEPTGTCIASVWSCECECPMTGTEGDVCNTFDEEIELWVDPSKTPAISCGDVGPDDDALAWQTLHDCVLVSVAGSAFHATWALPDGSDPYRFGATARVGVAYELGWFEASGTTAIVEYGCDAIVATPDCVVDVGEACLTCEAQLEVAVLCEDMP